MNKTRLIALIALAMVASIATYSLFNADTFSTEFIFKTNVRSSKNLTEEAKIKAAYLQWKKNHSKLFAQVEDSKRYSIFKKSYRIVESHNKKNLSWTLGLNQFATQTDEEFSALNLGLVIPPTQQLSSLPLFNGTLKGCPPTLDWRSAGIVTGVKNQGNCGSCWAFSTTGALEGLYGLVAKKLVAFSEQQLVDCSGPYGNRGCGGGYMNSAFTYVRDRGIQSASSYPYRAVQGGCGYNPGAVVFRLRGFQNIPQNNPGALGAAICQQPVAVGVQADQPAFRYYNGGVITGGCGTQMNHGIIAMGYGNGFWIVKNSWGTGWGEGGYARIASGTQNGGAGVCGINIGASVPVA